MTNIDLPNRDAGAYNHKLGSNIDLRTKLDHPTIKFVRPRALVAEQRLHHAGQVPAAPCDACAPAVLDDV